MNVITDESKIEEMLSRGVEAVLPSASTLRERLTSGRELSLYTGIDPTGPTLHIGHASALLKLRDFQNLGHRVILLIGDFTAMIGDPTDKSKTRKQLSKEEVAANLKNYLNQAGKIIDLSRTTVRYNSEWYSKMNLEQVLSLASEFTVSQMSERDMFQERAKAGEAVYLHEFLYPVMQGYDSVVLDVDLEVGGNDQTFNMLAGRTLLKRQGKDKHIMALKLLTDPAGMKMGKTEGNMVTLDDDPTTMYGKVMSWPDSLMPLAFEICTRLPLAELTTDNPRDLKMSLAREIVAICHGEGNAAEAEQQFVATFQKGGLPEDVLTIEMETGRMLVDLVLAQGLVDSKSAFRRLIEDGAISKMETGEKITDSQYKVDQSGVYKIGKHRFIKIIVN